MAYLDMPLPDVYRQAIRSGLAITYSIQATLGGTVVAADLRPTGGTISDTTKPGVRRVSNLELAPEPGLFDRLSPVGTLLRVTAKVRLTSRATVDIPMGVFDIDTESLSEGGGPLSLTAPDKWVRIQRARFLVPQASVRGARVVDEIVRLMRGALGASEAVNVLATSTAKVGALTWEKDRDKAILDLAKGIGAWCYFDRNGVFTIADISAGRSADWLVDASTTGVLTELDRDRSRTEARNVVVVESSASSGAAFPTQIAWDGDPTSPTYAGTNPRTNPGSAGPFGIVTMYYDTPLPLTAAGALRTARSLLSRSTGLSSQPSLGQVPNPAVDAFDTLDVIAPRERYDLPRATERVIADTVTHPLTLGPAQRIEGRATGSQLIEGAS